ncbi:MAG: 23S rRNA (adenine(2503)-C(2))-methyltransferase RlmN [Oscillospiraceae bacterium]|jgi:23S rRNA (adenine2503-C2)-methyltransferase|nr:23S rRNA (adenine(2503)-C(2))-methyltransferase RlmN [Oscillospiraceae bacterium]
MTDIKSLNLAELTAALKNLGEPQFRAKQIFVWLHKGVRGFDAMTNIPKQLRDRLNADFYVTAPELASRQVSAEDGTLKYLWRLGDGETVESVVMSYNHGNTICISTQVGCRQGCVFCASTLGGLVRNLAPSEMLDQVLFAQSDCGKRISNIVLMGIGEPLDNFDNVLRFLELVSHADGLNIGMRHISLSTCGLTEKIDKLGDLGLQLTLSVSLHAPDDATRGGIMPINRTHNVAELMDACRRYFAKTGRRISYEYAMIDGVNDTAEHARRLVKLLRGSGSHLNLILLNDVAERPLKPSRRENADAFTKILGSGNINFTFRRRLGRDIDAACGQLRRKTK